MNLFADLLERLAYAPARNAKLKLLADYFAAAPDPDRGWALAALTDGLPFSFPVRRTLMELVGPRVDAELYAMSRDYVGDTAETVALLWPEPGAEAGSMRPPSPKLGDVIATLALAPRDGLGPHLERWLDALDANGRWALLKLLTGAPRVGVSARLAKTALAQWAQAASQNAGESGINVDDIEEVWHGLAPPYAPLFAWLSGAAPRPDVSGTPVFRPMMLSHALEEADFEALALDEFALEWKWDGIRVQIASAHGATRLYSRTGEDIGAAFPDIAEGWRAEGVFDGELLVVRDGAVAPFADLQKRLNRRSVSKRLVDENPAHVRLYDALMIGEDDIRALPFDERRARLEAWHRVSGPPLTDISALVRAGDKVELQEIWSSTRESGIEGLMLKRRTSPYLPGRPRGHWFKWKRAALTADCVLMYAQRGSGKRSSYHSDFTFGAWRGGSDGGPAELVPVGKAYFGFTDDELRELDRWVRNNTVERYGPVRSVKFALVLEVAFDAVQRSPRHKSGIAMRFPRVHRIRWDKPAMEADRLETLEGMIEK